MRVAVRTPGPSGAKWWITRGVGRARGGGGGLGRAGACAGPCTGTPTHATRRRRAVEPRRTARPRRGYWGAGLGPIGAGHARRNKAGPSGREPHDDRHVRDPLPTWRLRIAPTSARPVPGVSASGFALSRRRRRTTRYNFRARVPTRGTADGAAPQHAQCAGPGPRRGRGSARVFLLLFCCLSVSLSANRHPDSIAYCFVERCERRAAPPGPLPRNAAAHHWRRPASPHRSRHL